MVERIATLTAPRCLDGFRTTTAAGTPVLLDTLTDAPNRFHALACRCRSEHFTVTGRVALNALIGQDVIVGPVTCRCARCRRSAVVFDPARHGYDVEVGHFPPTASAGAGGSTDSFACPGCGHTGWRLLARFEYPAALVAAIEAGEAPGYPEHVGREQDLFTWFTLIGTCGQCGVAYTIASHCCA